MKTRRNIFFNPLHFVLPNGSWKCIIATFSSRRLQFVISLSEKFSTRRKAYLPSHDIMPFLDTTPFSSVNIRRVDFRDCRWCITNICTYTYYIGLSLSVTFCVWQSLQESDDFVFYPAIVWLGRQLKLLSSRLLSSYAVKINRSATRLYE